MHPATLPLIDDLTQTHTFYLCEKENLEFIKPAPCCESQLPLAFQRVFLMLQECFRTFCIQRLLYLSFYGDQLWLATTIKSDPRTFSCYLHFRNLSAKPCREKKRLAQCRHSSLSHKCNCIDRSTQRLLSSDIPIDPCLLSKLSQTRMELWFQIMR